MHCLRSAEYVCPAEPEAIIMCSNFIADDAQNFVASVRFCDTSVYGLTTLALCFQLCGAGAMAKGLFWGFWLATNKATTSQRT